MLFPDGKAYCRFEQPILLFYTAYLNQRKMR
jgi:hypothetical protein